MSQPVTQFITHIIDHLVFFWSIVITTSAIDYMTEHVIKKPMSMCKLLGLVLFNQIFVTMPVFWLAGDFSVEKTSFFTTMLEIFYASCLVEVLFYTTHRILHTPFLYRNVHRVHHVWTMPVAIAAFYVHPLEHLLSNVLPVVLSAKIVGMSFHTVRMWHLISLLSALLSHEIFGFHTRHHLYFHYNYGVFGVLDYLFSTGY